MYRPNRTDVEHALELARAFRRSPNAECARCETISINERLPSAYAPYVAYVILPLFALNNAGVVLGSETLAGAAGSILTWGVVVGLGVGKLLSVFGSSTFVRRLKLGEPGVGLNLDRVLSGAALCGSSWISRRSSSGSGDSGQTLARPVDSARDHALGDPDTP